jgi:hypothetical protein
MLCRQSFNTTEVMTALYSLKPESLCVECHRFKEDVYRRPDHGGIVCSSCNHDIMRRNDPTNLVPVLYHLREQNRGKGVQ